MAEQVNIASLTIDVDDVIKESGRLKREIDKLKTSQTELDKTTEEGSEAFAENEVQIKKLSKAYKDNQMFATALDEANEDLNKTMAVQGKSTQELRDSRRQLNQISKNITGNTEEEIELREKLNKTIDEQTEALRDQSSDFNKSKDRVGEYKDSILEAVEELRKQKTVLIETRKELEANQLALTEGTEEYEDMSRALVKVNKDLDNVNNELEDTDKEVSITDFSVQGLAKSSLEAGGSMALLGIGAKKAASGIKVAAKAALAFILTPIGITLAIIAGAFLLIQNAMNRNEDSANKIKKAFSGRTGIFKIFFKIIEPIGKFLINGIAKGLELVGKIVSKVMNTITRVLERLGFEKVAAGIADFTEQVEAAAAASRALVEAEIDLQKMQRKARLIQLQFQKDAEKLRQIRDDETKSFKERIKANEDLGKVLKKQSEEELAIARKALEVAELRIQMDGASTENLDARADALVEIADIEERITGQESEQLVNRVSLQREATEAIVAANEAEADAAEEAAKRKMEAAKEAAEAAVAWAEFELNHYVRSNKSKLDSDKFLSEEAVKEEEKRLEEIANKRAVFAAEQFTKGTLEAVDYNNELAAIQEEYENNLKQLRLDRSAAEKERLAIDSENSLQLLEESLNSAFEIEALNLERNRELEVAAAEKTGADVNIIKDKYTQREIELQDAVNDAKIDGFGQVFESFASALGEETKAGKAAAIASTLISTYQSAQNAYTSLSGIPVVGVGLGIAAAGAAVIAGLKRVGKIRNTPEKLSKGAILSGRSHTSGGIPFSIGGELGFEAEDKESIINKKSTAMFRPLLSAINVAGGGKRFAGGAFLGSTSGSPSSLLIDYDLLASRIAQANENLPNPVVSVEEIETVKSNVDVVERLATS